MERLNAPRPLFEYCQRVADLRSRCVMTTFDPDTLQQNRGVLWKIMRKFGGKPALNCSVIRGNEIRVGDGVHLVKGYE